MHLLLRKTYYSPTTFCEIVVAFVVYRSVFRFIVYGLSFPAGIRFVYFYVDEYSFLNIYISYIGFVRFRVISYKQRNVIVKIGQLQIPYHLT